jgi:hypothetical protein
MAQFQQFLALCVVRTVPKIMKIKRGYVTIEDRYCPVRKMATPRDRFQSYSKRIKKPNN